MIDVLDAHMHTIASGHAYSTLNEMIASGKKKNLKLIGITEHTNKMPGTCHEIYFCNFKVIPRHQDDIEIRMGAEINIIDYYGNMDLSEKVFSKIDYGIASLHDLCISPVDILPMPKGRGFLDTNDTCLLK
ncbi:PHP domain-containing protein [Megamonas hypermegale]|uniref:PHP domain-containing protein n=1 Tax=Megamonas hypermegale TaxID=158847 RepID=UPI001EF4FC5C|nr:PHP domain-containing protein [Megamonas hypermegale]